MRVAEPSIMISVRLDPQVVALVDEIAIKFNVSRAGLLRAVISRWTELAYRPTRAHATMGASHGE